MNIREIIARESDVRIAGKLRRIKTIDMPSFPFMIEREFMDEDDNYYGVFLNKVTGERHIIISTYDSCIDIEVKEKKR